MKMLLKNLIKKQDEFFAIDRNLTLFPFFPVFYVNRESKIIIGNDFNGDLILVRGYVNEVVVLVMAGGNRGVINYQFKRIKN